MVLYTEYPKYFTDKKSLLELINSAKLHDTKSILKNKLCFHTLRATGKGNYKNNFINNSIKRIKYLGTNPNKEVKILYTGTCKTLLSKDS
jgi:hypothetical protein